MRDGGSDPSSKTDPPEGHVKKKLDFARKSRAFGLLRVFLLHFWRYIAPSAPGLVPHEWWAFGPQRWIPPTVGKST